MLKFLLLAAAVGASAPCAADVAYGDWTISCDNLKRCEAAGYGPDQEIEQKIALTVVREAGPNTPVKVELAMTGDDPDKRHGPVSITVDGHKLGAVRFHRPMPAPVASELLRRLIDGRKGEASEGGRRWSMPMSGVKAALLKMDEVQGRLDTPGALVRRGGRAEATVPPAPPIPVLRAAPPAKDVDDPALLAKVKAELPPAGDGADRYHALYRLQDGRLLLLRSVSSGAALELFDVWLANGRPPYAPRKLALPLVGAAMEEDLVNASFDGQVLASHANAPTEGYCHSQTEWLWTGQKFELLSHIHADLCRGFADAVVHRKWLARKAP